MKSTISDQSSSAEIVLGVDDPIRDVLSLARPRSVAAVPLRACAPWGARFTPFPHIKLGVMTQGECWLCIDGLEPILLRAGDFYLLGNPPPYTLGSSIEAAAASRTNDSVSDERLEGLPGQSLSATGSLTGAEAYMCSVDFEFEHADATTLFSSLPPALLVRSSDSAATLLSHLAHLLVDEVETPRPGRSLVVEHLAQILLVHMLRSHAGSSQESLGWIAAVADDGIGAALRAIHAQPRHAWTLQQLATIAMMSRSAFASNFKDRVGKPPGEYLIEWRMQLARAALATEDSLTSIAATIGYQSESAFSAAFRRVTGMPPRDFRASLKAAPAHEAEQKHHSDSTFGC